MDELVKYLLLIAFVFLAFFLWDLHVKVQGPQTGIEGFETLKPVDWMLTASGDFTLLVRNRDASLLEITAATADVRVGGGQCALKNSLPSETLKQHEYIFLNFTDCRITRQKGEYSKVNVSLDYRKYSSGETGRSEGVIWGPLQ
ncbi:MAG: hypothetical protein GF416_00185 [Candidatus Altiarchaeales archaeon]|nr:hypothetical protein [Candidatus Altiarchaeales archaeon]MBD3415539.1 hypothetical protein [Candidatus Altiarchaeales archaeon]